MQPAGEEVGMNNELHTLMRAALQANEVWHIAEDKSLGTFHQRVELCNYSEWITRKALAADGGAPFDEPFQGMPRILIDVMTFTPRLERIDEDQAKELCALISKEVAA